MTPICNMNTKQTLICGNAATVMPISFHEIAFDQCRLVTVK